MLVAGELPLTTGNGANSGFLPAPCTTPDGAVLKLAAAAVVGMVMLLVSWVHS